MSISVTNANQFLRRSLVKDAVLVVPDRTAGALQTVLLTNQRLSRLSQTINNIVKDKEYTEDKNRREAAFKERYAAIKKRNKSSYLNFPNSIYNKDADSYGGGGGVLKIAAGLLSKSLKMVAVGALGALGGLVAGGMLYGSYSGNKALKEKFNWGKDTGKPFSKKEMDKLLKLGNSYITEQNKGNTIFKNADKKTSKFISSRWAEIQTAWSKGTSHVSENVKHAWREFTDSTTKYSAVAEQWFVKQGTNLNGWFDSIVAQLNKYISSFELKKIAADWLASISNWLKNKFGFSGSGTGGGNAPTGSGSTDVETSSGGPITETPLPVLPPKDYFPNNPARPSAPRTPTPDTAYPKSPFGGLVAPGSPEWKKGENPYGGLVTPNNPESKTEAHPATPAVGTTGKAYYPDWMDEKSRGQLAGVNKELVEDLLEASKKTGINFSVSQGMRTPEEAAANARRGIGVRNSQHLYGAAVDIKIPGGNWNSYKTLGDAYEAIAAKKEHSGRWLGNVDGRWGRDIFHFDQGIGYGQEHQRNPYDTGEDTPAREPTEKGRDTTGGKRVSEMKTFGNVDLAFGDSTAVRLGLPGNAVVGRSPRDSEAALDEYLKTHDVKGKNIALSSVSNDNSMTGYNHVISMANKLKAAGANVNILGTGPGGSSGYRAQDPKYNKMLADYAAENGMAFTPMGRTADSIHEVSGKDQLRAMQNVPFGTDEDKPSAGKSVENPHALYKVPMTMPEAVKDNPVKFTETKEQAGTPYKDQSNDDSPGEKNERNRTDGTPVSGNSPMDAIATHPIDPHLLAKNLGDRL